MNLIKLPSFLPSLPPPQVEQYEVYQKLLSLNNTKITLPMDIPAKLREVILKKKPLTFGHFPKEALSPPPPPPPPTFRFGHS